MKYKELKDRARQIAIDWQLANAAPGSYEDVARAGDYFYSLGKRYGLLREFRESGVPC